MKGITVKPELRSERWYTTAEAVKALEMDRTTFWRFVKSGIISRRFQAHTLKPMYQGKELLKFWQNYLMPL